MDTDFRQVLDIVWLGNTLSSYILSLGIATGGMLLIWLFKKAGIRLLRKQAAQTTTDVDDKIVAAIEARVIPILYLAVLWLSLQNLTMSAVVTKGTKAFFTVMVTFFSVRLVLRLLYLSLDTALKKRSETDDRKKVLGGIFAGLQVVVWGIALVVMLDNLGFKISTLVAGLGIGGVAIALASQTLLADLFSYFAISFDRPFEIGDFIVIDNFKGTVEHIGVKTTRLQSLNGEQIVFCNSDLIGSRVRNYKRLQRRRAEFTFGVTYNTALDKVKAIPEYIKTIIAQTPETTFDRAHFKEFGSFSLNFEIVYYVTNPDYNQFMDIQQAINCRIMERFAAEGIEFAFPTQTLQVAIS